MRKWQHHIKIAEEFQAAKRGDLTPTELARTLAKRLRRISLYFVNDFEYADLIDIFETEEFTRDSFDSAFNELYNWADENRVWIAAQ